MKIIWKSLLCAFLLFSCENRPSSSQGKLQLLTTGNLGAELEPCGCRDNPVGGISRKANFIERLERQGSFPLQFDTGDAFFESNRLHPDMKSQLSYKAKQVVEAYNRLGVKAVAIGDRDFAGGVAFLKDLEKRANFPFVATNLVDPKTKKPLFKTHAVVEHKGLKIGVIGVSPVDIINEFYKDEALALGPNVVRDEYNKIKNQMDVIVVLIHETSRASQDYAKNFPEISLWLTADTGGSDQPETQGSQLFISPQLQAQKISLLSFDCQAPIKKWVNNTLAESTRIEIEEFEKELAHLKESKLKEKDDVIQEERAYTEAKIKELRLRLPSNQKGECAFEHKMVEMSTDYEGFNPLQQIVNDYKIAVQKGTFQDESQNQMATYRELKKAPEVMRPKGLVQEHAEGVSTYLRCQSCHEEQFKFWEKTSHYSAMLPLYTRGEHMNRECLTCHSIGMKEPQGWSNPRTLVATANWDPEKFFSDVFKGDSKKFLKKAHNVKRWEKLHDSYGKHIASYVESRPLETKVFMGVQCEHCHGRRLNHPHDGKDYPKKVSQEACLSCHQPKHSDGFSFEKWRPLVACPSMNK